MKKLRLEYLPALSMIILALLTFLAPNEIYGQDDEARQQNGLPTLVGSRPGATGLTNAGTTLSGTLTVQGIIDENSAPVFSVLLLLNGQPLAKQRVKNRGAFNFSGVPERGVTLVVEADNIEIANYPLSQLAPSPLPNRQDILIPWIQAGQKIKQQNEVISLRNSHPRSEANQKSLEKALDGIKENKVDAAIKLLKGIVENDAADFIAWTELGNAYFLKEKASEADDSYNKALAIKNDFLPALINLGKFYLSRKNYEKSVEILDRALVVSPKSADVNHYLGEAYLQSKKGSKAVVYLNEALNLAPIEKAEIHLRLASLYNAAGAKDRAVAEYRLFLKKMPDHTEKTKIEKYIAENSAK